jgi:uncharacterized coiled-coil protein SlyX
VSEIDLAEVATHTDLVACLDRLYIRADSPSYRDLEQRTAKRSGSELPSTGLKRVRLGRSAIGELLRGSAFPKKAFLLTFVEACGVDVAADRRWAQAWDRLSERHAKRAGQAQTELAQLRAEVARLHAEVDAEQLAAKKAQAEEANLRAQLADAAQNAEKARLEALRRLERIQQQLAHAQAEATRLRQEVKELTEKLGAQEQEAAQPSHPAPAAANPPGYRHVFGSPKSRGDRAADHAPPRHITTTLQGAWEMYEAPSPQEADSYPAAPAYGYRAAERQDPPRYPAPQMTPATAGTPSLSRPEAPAPQEADSYPADQDYAYPAEEQQDVREHPAPQMAAPTAGTPSPREMTGYSGPRAPQMADSYPADQDYAYPAEEQQHPRDWHDLPVLVDDPPIVVDAQADVNMPIVDTRS